jgi:NAD(P)-dependent dehydrogenase (short-subunit alcohol dehydrogenase family)
MGSEEKFEVRPDPFDVDSVNELAPDRLYSLRGKVALVTGGGGDLGRYLAAGLGAAGAELLLTDVKASELAESVRVLTAGGITADAVEADLLAADTPDRLVQTVLDRFGRLDVLVNCAGVNRRQPMFDVTPESYDWITGVDLRAPYFLARAAARVMAARGGGVIVNIGSLNSAVGLENVSVYGAAKSGLSQLTKVMAVEWTHLGVRANCLAPGFMLTTLSRALWENRSSRRWMVDRIPMKRPGRPRELVGMCLLLASDAGSYINGQTFYVDGGFLAGSRWMADEG